MALPAYGVPLRPGRRYLRQMLLIMKFTTLFLFVAIMHVSAKTYSQKVSLSLTDVPLKTVFLEINAQTGYNFLYSDEVLATSKNVSLHVTNASIEDVLALCFKGQPFSFTVRNNSIIIQKTIPQKSEDASLPPIDIHGRVTDSLGNPLSGASILVKGSKRGTTTDVNGYFTLIGVKENAVLNISYTGYTHKEYKWTGDASFSVTLIKSNNPLDAVVVIPYGTTTQRLNTGDVGTVTAKTIEQQPVSNVLEALEGQVPGLFITQTTGLPGGSYKVQIRGQNSLINGIDPLYVVDGVPYNSQLALAPLNGNLNAGSPLNYINPNDIESVEVLKDADATAIYGSRAANGAILITTKKGKAGDMKFDVNVKSGITEPARTIPILNTPQYLAMRHEAFENDGETPGPGDHDINGDWDTTRNVDWPALMANKPAQYTDIEAGISGGTTNIQYLISGGYIVNKTGYPTLVSSDGADKKGSLHFNFNNSSADKRFKFALTGSYLADKNTVQSADFTSTALTLAPDAPPIFNQDGSLNWAPKAPGQRGTWANPYAGLNDIYVSNTSNLVGNAILSYTLLKGLELKASFGYTNTQTDEVQATPTTAFDPARKIASGHSNFSTVNSHSWIAEPQAEYRLQAGRGVFTALAGATFLENNFSTVYEYASEFVSDALIEDLQSAGSVYVYSNSADYKYEAVFGRMGYNWMDKYLINISARRDGTSRFGPGKQFGNFGAIGAGWIFTKEDFFQNHVGFLSFGKIRGSYGTTGSDQVGDYQFVDLYSPTNLPYEGSRGLYPFNLSNADLAWETTKKIEAGIELGFLKDRIMIQASWYQNRSGNELVQTPVSQVTGFLYISSNLPALVQNAGEEFLLNTINIRTKHFTWSSSFNLSMARNKLVAYPNLASSPYANQFVIGQPITVRKLFHSLGVNDTTGLYEFASQKTGPTYTPNNLTDANTYLDLTPKFYGGFQNNFSWKGFSLDVFFQFVKQTGVRLWAIYNAIPGIMFNQPAEALNRWQSPGDKKPFQRFTQDYGSSAASTYSYAQQSDFAYGDASYIRLKNLAISWQLPENWIKKMRLSNFRIYVQGQNLATITKYDGMDPESQSATIGPRKVFVGGVRIGW
jgi:TonB-dependent starch-binding outer membrane protein SusC